MDRIVYPTVIAASAHNFIVTSFNKLGRVPAWPVDRNATLPLFRLDIGFSWLKAVGYRTSSMASILGSLLMESKLEGVAEW